MKTYVQPGNTITLTAPYAVAAGDGLQVGSIFVVASGTAALGETVEAALVGVYELKKLGSQAWAVGDRIYPSTSSISPRIERMSVASSLRSAMASAA
jgi:predicted RecA/RadA family phage recombinase